MNRTILCTVALALTAACSSGDAAGRSVGPGTDPRGSVGVGQGGAQDIALFRSVVEAGEVPDPEMLDPIGFFAEHAVDLPAADCGEVVCAHPMLAVAPRFDGSNWTMAFVGLNSSVDVSTRARPPLRLAIVIDVSDRTAALRASLLEAAAMLVTPLRAEDRVSIIVAGSEAQVLADTLAPVDPALGDAIELAAGLSSTSVALYDAMAIAGELVSDDPANLRHLVVLSSGRADAGLASETQVLALAEGLAERGVTISTIGGGDDYIQRVPLAIGELGAGAYYFAEGGADLIDIFDLEGRTALFPIARDFELVVTPAPGYRVGRVTGARRVVADDTRAVLGSPVLLLGQRTGASDIDRGRRGGGGGLFVELVADAASGLAAGAPAFSIEVRYVDETGRAVTLTDTVNNRLSPGVNPPLDARGQMQANFSDDAHAKVFMMLNMYLALRASVEFYEAGDCARAIGTVDMVSEAVEIWQASVFADPDTTADFQLLLDVRDNLVTTCTADGAGIDPIEPRNFRGGCFGS